MTFPTWTRIEAMEFAAVSAYTAEDQKAAYADPVESYRVNIIDTLREYGASQYLIPVMAEYFRILERLESERK